MTYLSAAQVEQLLKPINPARVSVRDGMSHLEAYDVRAHLTRIFGFGRWSADLIDLTGLYESVSEDGKRVSVGYRATMRLAVMTPDGTLLATYTEAAAGSATNFPISKRADAADFAIKTAESQALKRCAINLGDNFGLSLYQKGSREALVRRVLVMPDLDGTAEQDVTHDAVPVTPEHGEEQPDTTNDVSGQATPDSTSAVEPTAPAPPSGSPDVKAALAAEAKRLRDKALEASKNEDKTRALQLLAKVNFDAGKARAMNETVRAENGDEVTLGVLVDSLIKLRSRSAA